MVIILDTSLLLLVFIIIFEEYNYIQEGFCNNIACIFFIEHDACKVHAYLVC